MSLLLFTLAMLQVQSAKGQAERIISVCEALTDAEKFHGQTVAVRGGLVVGPENTFLAATGCVPPSIPPSLASSIWLSFPQEARRQGVLVSDNPAVVEQFRSLVKALGMSMDFIPGLTGPPSKADPSIDRTVVIRGLFQSKLIPRTYPDGKSDPIGYGHLGGFRARIVMQSIERSPGN